MKPNKIRRFYSKTLKIGLYLRIITGGALIMALVPVTAVAAGTDSFSRNWSGYSASESGSIYSAVGSSWTVPQATGNGYSADAAWVGIGGITGTDLIQVGTHAIADNVLTSANSSATYKYGAWYELLPAAMVPIPVVIKPGDAVTASITQKASNQWLITFKNISTGQNFETIVIYNSLMSSAEWIQEMPLNSATRTFVPLDNFGTINFKNSWAIKNNAIVNIQQVGASPITMLSYSNEVLASTSGLGADGGSFSVARTTASVASPVLAFANTVSLAPSVKTVKASKIVKNLKVTKR